jgi:mRNA interferase MazF
MSVKRGDVVVVDWPFTGGSGSKARPAIVIQNDKDNVRLLNTIIAMVTSRIQRAGEPTQVLVDVSTPEGQQTGLHRTSVVNCVNLFTVEQVKIVQKIGEISTTLMHKVEMGLKLALSLP